MKFSLLFLLISFQLHASQLCPELRDSISSYVQAAISGERQYEVERPLITYMGELYVRKSPLDPNSTVELIRFTDDLYALKPTDRWLDLGSGEGYAITDAYTNLNSLKRSLKESKYLMANPPVKEFRYLMEELNILKRSPPSPFDDRSKIWTQNFLAFILRPNKEKPFATGVTYEMNRKPPLNAKYEFKTGKLFSEYGASDFAGTKLITDFYGVHSYVKDVSGYFKQIFEILPVGGRAYIKNSHTYVRKPKRLFRSSIEEDEPIASWIARKAEGVMVHKQEGGLTFILEKVAPSVSIPKLKLIEFRDGKPPTRIYSE